MGQKYFSWLLVLLFSFCSSLGIFAESPERFNEDLLKVFTYRNIGPFRNGSRIVDFAVPEFPQEAHLYTFYVASASGGLWKTTNNGTTFIPIFDDQSVISIGDIALAPTDPDIIWVGTGEGNNSRSAYWGNGVYKSSDGGKTWTNMGLKESHHIARIIVHPKNPDIVYVAALGHLYSFNEERGLFKTVDGGKTWEKSLFINEKVGVTDVVINPESPDILYAVSYEKQRLPWNFIEGGPGTAIYKSLDAGETWTQLRSGLPTGMIGRIALAIYPKNPSIIYAHIENSNLRAPTEGEIKQARQRGLEPSKRVIGGEVYRSDDAGDNWEKMNSPDDDIGGKAPYYFGQIRVDPNNDQVIYVLSLWLNKSSDAGRTWRDEMRNMVNAAPRSFGDNHALWIDPQNSSRMILGNDGGVHITYDGGKSWDFYDNLPLSQYYAIGVDMEDPYNVYGGLQDHYSWKGPSNSWSGQVTLEDWVSIGGGDGMYNVVDPKDSRWLYNTSSFGNHYRVDQKLGFRKSIYPVREEGKDRYRFNWCCPVLISPHNSHTIYTGAQVLLRSKNQGDDWEEISPDLTLTDPIKILGRGDAIGGRIEYCTIVTISESPIKSGIIWVGTDDGKVWVTKDQGTSWNDLTKNISAAGAPENYWVSRVFSSNFKEGTAYVSKTGYRRDDFMPFLYKTTNYGVTWTPIVNNLPNESVNVIVEDHKNPNLLFIGTEMGVYVSINGGKRWVRMRNNMPTNAVHDILLHPRENDLLVATHGRGLFITNITPLQEMNENVLSEDIYLFKIRPHTPRVVSTFGGAYHLFGHRHHSEPNEPNAIVINYYLKENLDRKPEIKISDSSGRIIKSLDGAASAGINQVLWDMRSRLTQEEIALKRTDPRRARRMPVRLEPPGEYLVYFKAGDKQLTQKAIIRERSKK
jgi:photosystem II stability/assembly factor-like uncharacterized protein